MQLTPFLRDPYVIRAQIARHAQPRTTPANRVKLVQKSGFIRDPYAILLFGLSDQVFKQMTPQMRCRPYRISVCYKQGEESSKCTNQFLHLYIRLTIHKWCIQTS